MVIAIWVLALILLLFWSAFAWMSHALLSMISSVPWEQVLGQLKGISLPEPFGAWWAIAVDMLAPVLQFSVPLLQGLLSFAGSALPVIAFVLWLIGAVLLLLLAIAATFGVAFWRKNHTGIKSKLSHL
jgi:fumarate reductase subunit D